jgi:hypothetical protein
MKKSKALLIQGLLCFLGLSCCSILYLEKQNKLTELRLYAPRLALEIREIQEENTRLQYQVQEFESSEHLIRLLQQERFAHLKHPVNKDILVFRQDKEFFPIESKQTFVAGVP